MIYRCGYCHKEFKKEKDCANHMIKNHADDIKKYKEIFMKKKEIKTSALKRIIEKVKTFKPSISINGFLNFGFGWYRGDSFSIFSISLFENWCDSFTFLSLKVAKLSITISFVRGQ